MRTSVKILAAAAVSGLGLIAIPASPALASVAAPSCDSGASTVDCDALAGVSPWTWTIVIHFEGTVTNSSYQTTVNFTKFGARAASRSPSATATSPAG